MEAGDRELEAAGRKREAGGGPATALARWARGACPERRRRAQEWTAVLSLLGGIAAWEIAGRTLGLAFLPPFSAVVSAGAELVGSAEVRRHLGVSLVSLTIGFGLAVGLGLPAGAVMGRFRKIEHFFDLYLHALLATPSLIYIPILFAWFGVGRATQMAVIFLYAFFVIVANTMAGVRSGDAGLAEMARSFGAGGRQVFFRVVLPGALPLVMAGLRLGMARAMKGMINGEMFIALMGLGALIRTYGGRFDSVRVLGVLLLIVTVAVLGVGLVQVLERRLTRWAD
ncbi:MAG: ABC transporter permease [Anaerolineales bacterium]